MVEEIYNSLRISRCLTNVRESSYIVDHQVRVCVCGVDREGDERFLSERASSETPEIEKRDLGEVGEVGLRATRVGDGKLGHTLMFHAGSSSRASAPVAPSRVDRMLQ